jgi:hypothetical protein
MLNEQPLGHIDFSPNVKFILVFKTTLILSEFLVRILRPKPAGTGLETSPTKILKV